MVVVRNMKGMRRGNHEDRPTFDVFTPCEDVEEIMGSYKMGLHFLAKFTSNTATVAPNILRCRLSGSEEPRDDVRRLYETLCQECSQVQEDKEKKQITCGKQKEENRKREERVTGLTKEDITKENDELQEQTKEYKRKISMTKDLIEQVEHNYENSKRFIAIQRYRLMKTMMKKTVIHNKWI